MHPHWLRTCNFVKCHKFMRKDQPSYKRLVLIEKILAGDKFARTFFPVWSGLARALHCWGWWIESLGHRPPLSWSSHLAHTTSLPKCPAHHRIQSKLERTLLKRDSGTSSSSPFPFWWAILKIVYCSFEIKLNEHQEAMHYQCMHAEHFIFACQCFLCHIIVGIKIK